MKQGLESSRPCSFLGFGIVRAYGFQIFSRFMESRKVSGLTRDRKSQSPGQGIHTHARNSQTSDRACRDRETIPFLFTSGNCRRRTEQGAAVPCRAGNNSAALDFWLGSCRVTDDSGVDFYGTNRVELVVNGCAIFEHWTNRDGGEGKSLFYYGEVSDTWAQVWVTDDTARPV